ncbi:RimK family alpha-L-glutamate ligase [Kitasatospora sp. NPDC059673]|uniref:RimK family alpha-L-glutamate ligase n=1 Tax=Kitasatospora sp. NPDC059673 TaxID=3346901 RepID=UPI0036C918BE
MRSTDPLVLIATRIRIEERQLVEALRRRSIPYLHVDDRTLVYRIGEPPPAWRVVLNRALSATRRLEASRYCETAGIPVVNSTATLDLCDNKIACTSALHLAGVEVPATAVALDPAAGALAVEQVGLPAVVKPVVGSWGRGIARVDGPDAVDAVFTLREQLSSPVQKLGYAQEFVHGRDLRVLVVGGQAVAAIERTGEHWVRNTARGARATACPLDPELAALAERAAKAVGGGILGVDLLETRAGRRLVVEVNGGVEFHGLAEAHPGLSIADLMIDYVLDRNP